MRKIGALIFVGVLTAIIIWGSLLSHPAASQQVESRLSNLEADFRRLEAQVNQLQSQRGQPRAPSPTTTLTPRQTQPSRRNLSQQERDKMFDRLATLVVELKQQANTLEERVAKLESR
jgi:outer membrane murein-binding lipoprotein Lpp